MKATGAVLALALLCLAPRANAAGFALYETSTRALGVAGAYTGLADTPAAIFFNPAGLADQSGLKLEVNVAMVIPTFDYDTTVPGSTQEVNIGVESKVFTLPSLYASYRVHERVAVGFGTYVPFGLGVKWPETFSINGKDVPWWGRSLIKEIELQTFFMNATVAFKLHDRVFIGGGFVIGLGAVHLKRAITASNNPQDDINIELSGSDVAFGATAGILVKVIPGVLNVGVAYKSAMKMTFEGDAAFTKGGTAAGVPAGLRPRLQDGRVEAPITLPHTISFGVTAFPMERLMLGLNVEVVTWSSYEQLEIKFPDNPQLSTSDRKSWKNVFQLRIGAEYKVLENNLPVRLGFIFDQSPVPDDTVGPEMPDTDRYWLTFGVGYKIFGIQADLAYQILITSPDATTSTAPIVGKRSASAHIMSLGLGYNFDL